MNRGATNPLPPRVRRVHQAQHRPPGQPAPQDAR